MSGENIERKIFSQKIKKYIYGLLCIVMIYKIWFCILIFTVVSCQKQVPDQVQLSRYDLLTSGKWQLSNLYLVDVATSKKADFTSSQYQPCELVDTFAFGKDSIFHRIHPDPDCEIKWLFGPNEGAAWWLDSSDTRLVISHEYDFYHPYKWNGKILQLDNATLEFQCNYKNYFGDDAAYIFVFKPVK